MRTDAALIISDASIGTVLWRLATPNVLAVTMMTAVTFFDAWYVGQIGTAALASLALVFPFLTLMQMLAGGAVGGATTSAVARAVGAGSKVRAEAIAWHALLLALFMSVLFMFGVGGFARPIFILLGGSGEALDGAVRYAYVIFGGASATWLVWVVAAIHRGVGDTVTPARAILTTSAVQIPLSGVLVVGWMGIPSMGVAGAAIAWVICHTVAATYLLLKLTTSDSRLRLRPHKLSWPPFQDLLKVGGLGFINSICMAMTVVVVTGYVGRYGTEALAGYGLGARLELMLTPIAFGIGAALTAAVGVNVGANQFARARRFACYGAAATLVLTGLIGFCATAVPSLWLGLFTANPQVFEFGAHYLAIAAPWYGLFGAGQALYFASQGTGRMGWPVLVSVIRFAVIVGLCALAVTYEWGVTGLFAAVAVGLVIMGVGQTLCLVTPGWRSAQ